MLQSLQGKTSLVTGASRGIGRAIALALAAAGSRVLIHYCDGAGAADATVAAIRSAGGQADKVQTDLMDPDGPQQLARLTREVLGNRLDVLVANAGRSYTASIEETTVGAFDELYALNVRAPFFLVQQLLPAMGEGGAIIFVSSLAAHAAGANIPAYAATKGAIETLVKHLAAALGPRGIRVTGVAPGIVQTDMTAFTRTPSGRNAALDMQALKRLAQPEDVAPVVAFLVSGAAGWISGDVLRVDGGSKL
jgi:NAD(P)-dependent dehydrogenase (short-subunit alcohol dehydrogenase family)